MRQMLNSNSQQKQNTQQLTTRGTREKAVDPIDLQHVLRKKRSKKYIEAMKTLDAGGHAMNKQQVDALLKDISDEFGDLYMNITGQLLGVVSQCFLGIPYEVHTLDPTGQIIEHFKTGERLPGQLEKARGLAMRGGYAFIEVYTTFCAAVSDSGSVSIIKD